jgi:hypothetical protein
MEQFTRKMTPNTKGIGTTKNFKVYDKKKSHNYALFSVLRIRIRIRICRIRIFLGLLDPDPSIIKQKE